MARPRTKSDGEILEAARTCFLEHGPAVSTTLIADSVGLSQSALFKRFGSKQELMLQALMPPAEPAWLDTVRDGPDGRPIPDQLLEIGLAAADFFAHMTPAMMTLKASGLDERVILCRYEVPPPARALQLLTAWLQAAMDQGRIRPVSALDLAMSFMGLIHGRSFLQHIAGDWLPFRPVEESIRQHVDVLWRGLSPEEDQP